MDKYFLALDIETSGPSYTRNGILSIGASLQDKDLKEHQAFQVNINLAANEEFDKGCWDQFWSKHPKAYEFVISNTIDIQEAMDKLCLFLEEMEEKYPNMDLISDVPSYDIAWLNYYLSKYTARHPLNYTSTGKYRMIWDSSSIQKVWSCVKAKDKSLIPKPGHIENLGLKSKWEHDHNPLNDARVIASNYIQTISQIKSFLEASS